MPENTIKITGNLTQENHDECQNWINIAPVDKDLVVDLASIGDIDSTCVAVLVALKRKTQVNEISISFANLPEKLMKLIHFYQVGEILNLSNA